MRLSINGKRKGLLNRENSLQSMEREKAHANEKGDPLGPPSPGASVAPPRPEPAQRAPGAGGALLSHRVAPAVPSALAGLTSGFGPLPARAPRHRGRRPRRGIARLRPLSGAPTTQEHPDNSSIEGSQGNRPPSFAHRPRRICKADYRGAAPAPRASKNTKNS